MRALMFMLVLVFVQPLLAKDRSGDYAAAADAYRQGDFAEAIEIYLTAIQDGEESASLLYNLGTNLYKNGETGAALAAHLRARSLDPADPDIRYNVRFLQEKSRDKLESHLTSDRWRDIRATRWFTERTLFWCTVIPLALALCLVGWQLRSGRAPWLSWVLGIALLLSALYPGLGLAHRLWHEPDWGAIAAPQVDVLASPTVRNAVVIFQLHEGAPCAVINKSGDWFKIQISDGKTGWVPREQLAIFGKRFFSYQSSKNEGPAENSAL
ncbi:tetratricopeptide repeat protein [Oligoflexus tunisiensis]|uniref:tetratricopeptide repeat protein n=1 Tax=Oligoflexus tunisiensis TaxID=708132 RepID=UPI00114C8BF4|nr:SH3 domain-containing protein [Oligoflexus tunisiensis]